MKTVVFLCIFLFCHLTSYSANNDILVKSPVFTITTIETGISVEGLTGSEIKYEVSVNDEVIQSDNIKLSKPVIKIQFLRPGNNVITVTTPEGAKAQTNLRVISGWMSVLPPLIAIILALLTKEVITSLFAGIFAGSLIVFDFHILSAFLRTIDKYILNALADSAHASIIIFSVALGGMIGIINHTGGMTGIVNLLSRFVRGPKSSQLATWFMGVVIFFDDYANTIIVGNSMRPVTDKYKISREKLSYLVDSTAAPIAGIALLSTWIGYEIGLIRDAYISLQIPETNFYGVFLQTIPFRFYCLLALFFGFLVAITRRDFGPMHKAEQRAHNEGLLLAKDASPLSDPESSMPDLPEKMPKRWYNAAIPILVVILVTFVGLVADGGAFVEHYDLIEAKTDKENNQYYTFQSAEIDNNLINVTDTKGNKVKLYVKNITSFNDLQNDKALNAIFNLTAGEKIIATTSPSTITPSERLRSGFAGGDSTRSLMWGAVIGSITALLLGLIQGLIKLEQGMKAWVNGGKTLVMAICLMLLAWAISAVCGELNTAKYIVAMVSDTLPYWLLPAVAFIIASLIAFATGSSWGTMAILLPLTIPLAYRLNLSHYEEVIANSPSAPEAMLYVKQMLLVSVGAVLEGAIFGDHCSPISDTTIMSSMASGADHIDHVKTQAPYALLVGATAILLCYIPAGLGAPPTILIPLSMIILTIFIFYFGKTPDTKV